MSERMIPGAIIIPPEADLTGSPAPTVNILERFMTMAEHVDLSYDTMNVGKAKNILIGGLVLAHGDLDGQPKLTSLMEETIDREKTYRKLRQEPQPTLRMMAIMARMNPKAAREEVRQAQPSERYAGSVGSFDRQGFVDLRSQLTAHSESVVTSARVRAHSEFDDRHRVYAEGEQS